MSFNPITPLYSILHAQILPLVEKLADSQVANLVRLMEGLFKGRSVHLSRIVSEIRGKALKLSQVAQLSRFLGNERVDVRRVYEPVARELLKQAAQAGRLVFIIDSSKVGFGAQFVMVALAYQGLPCRSCGRGWSIPKGTV